MEVAETGLRPRYDCIRYALFTVPLTPWNYYTHWYESVYLMPHNLIVCFVLEFLKTEMSLLQVTYEKCYPFLCSGKKLVRLETFSPDFS